MIHHSGGFGIQSSSGGSSQVVLDDGVAGLSSLYDRKGTVLSGAPMSIGMHERLELDATVE